MYRAVKVRQVLVCQANPEGSKYPFRVKTLERAEVRVDDKRSVETAEVKAFNSMVEVPTGVHLLVVEGGVLTERSGRDIKSITEWERIEAFVPPGASIERLKQMLEPQSKAPRGAQGHEARPELDAKASGRLS